MNGSEALIYTSKGNVLESSLKYSHQWELSDKLVVFREFWHDETGELVKNNVHAYSLQGMDPIGGQQALM